MFEWLTNLFSQHTDKIQQIAEEGMQSAQGITDMIPGDLDNQAVEGITTKVEEVTGQFEEIKNNLPKP